MVKRIVNVPSYLSKRSQFRALLSMKPLLLVSVLPSNVRLLDGNLGSNKGIKTLGGKQKNLIDTCETIEYYYFVEVLSNRYINIY